MHAKIKNMRDSKIRCYKIKDLYEFYLNHKTSMTEQNININK